MDAEQLQYIEISELKSIERYFWVLLNAYPQPINQTELAKRAGVTRAAVSRVKGVLNKICDLKSLAYERKLVLKNDIDTRMSFLIYVVFVNEPTEFKSYISSQYFIDIINETDLYNKMKKRFEIYNFENYFNEDDFKWVLNFSFQKIIFHESEIEEGVIYFTIKDEPLKNSYITNLPFIMQFINSLVQDSSLLFLTKREDFIKLLEFRDKLYYFITNNEGIYLGALNDTVNWLEIKDPKNREVVDKASKIVFDQALKKTLKNYSIHVYTEASKIDVSINRKYEKIGSLFQI